MWQLLQLGLSFVSGMEHIMPIKFGKPTGRLDEQVRNHHSAHVQCLNSCHTAADTKSQTKTNLSISGAVKKFTELVKSDM